MSDAAADQQESTRSSPPITGFESFVRKYNEAYINRCKEIGLKDEFDIELDTEKTVTFLHVKVSTGKFEALEKARAEVEQKNMNDRDGIAAAQRQADLYFFMAQAYLKNKETRQPISKEEFIHTVWEEMKMVLDACHLRTMMGVVP